MGKFGELLRSYRSSLNLAQCTLAAMVGVVPSYISQIERGHCNPPGPSPMKKLAVIFGLENEELDDFYKAAGYRSRSDIPFTMKPEDYRVEREGLPALLDDFLQYNPAYIDLKSIKDSILVDAEIIGFPHLISIEKERLNLPEAPNQWGKEAYKTIYSSFSLRGWWHWHKRNWDMEKMAYASSSDSIETETHITKAIQFYTVEQRRASLLKSPMEMAENKQEPSKEPDQIPDENKSLEQTVL